MNRSLATIAALLLVGGQTTMASAATSDSPVLTKASMPSCELPGNPAKVVKARAKINRCDADENPMKIGTVPLVFGGAIIAGVVAIGVGSKGGHATSP